jgi:hypothetical protein
LNPSLLPIPPQGHIESFSAAKDIAKKVLEAVLRTITPSPNVGEKKRGEPRQ